jgi:hypothetical protein
VLSSGDRASVSSTKKLSALVSEFHYEKIGFLKYSMPRSSVGLNASPLKTPNLCKYKILFYKNTWVDG